MNIFSLTFQQLNEYLLSLNGKSYRSKQIFDWIYSKYVFDFDQMRNLPKNLIKKLKEDFSFFSIKLHKKFVSKEKETIKYLFQLSDGFFIESVLILSKSRKTICISSQVGCKANCEFCASGKKGFKRDLSFTEMVEQFAFIAKDINERLSNIVFMGMGEPLFNLENVLRAIEIFSSENTFNISNRKITVSTVGLIKQIEKLIEKNTKVNLTLSLHAPNQLIREQLMPLAKKNVLEDLLNALEKYYLKTKRNITFEYILIDNINDTISHAKELLYLLRNFSYHQIKVNLIPFNEIKGTNLRRSKNSSIKSFKEYLLKNNVNVVQRYAKGKDIDAACGQLAYIQENI